MTPSRGMGIGLVLSRICMEQNWTMISCFYMGKGLGNLKKIVKLGVKGLFVGTDWKIAIDSMYFLYYPPLPPDHAMVSSSQVQMHNQP